MTAAPVTRSYTFDVAEGVAVAVTVWPDRDATGERRISTHWQPAPPQRLDVGQLRRLYAVARRQFETAMAQEVDR